MEHSAYCRPIPSEVAVVVAEVAEVDFLHHEAVEDQDLQRLLLLMPSCRKHRPSFLPPAISPLLFRRSPPRPSSPVVEELQDLLLDLLSSSVIGGRPASRHRLCLGCPSLNLRAPKRVHPSTCWCISRTIGTSPISTQSLPTIIGLQLPRPDFPRP